MLKRPALIAFAVCVLGGALLFGLVQLFSLRFERGDVYPSYSTFRADPLGAKALHDALAESRGYTVQRNFRPITKPEIRESLTIVYAGIARRSLWGDDEMKAFETLATNGTRAVFAFAPEDLSSGAAVPPVTISVGKPPPKKIPAATPAPAPVPLPVLPTDGSTAPATPPTPALPDPDEPKDDISADEDSHTIAFKDVLSRWGAGFALPQGKAGAAFDQRAEATGEAVALEPDLTWHSALYFKNLGPHWRTLYTSNGKPVIVERKFGDGSIVLAADSYFLSNEALRRERRTRLLAWLIGPPRTIIFDEQHLGVSENGNLATLTRKYRLQGLLAGLCAVAALFVWKHAVPLLPKRRDPRDDDAEVRGKDAESGFINLLRRSIPRSQIVKICVDEWEKSCGHRAREAELTHVRAVARAHDSKRARDSVAAYRTIAAGLARGNPHSENRKL